MTQMAVNDKSALFVMYIENKKTLPYWEYVYFFAKAILINISL